MARTLRKHGHDIFLGEEWFVRMAELHNPIMLGFCVEQMCLSSISQKGLNAAGLAPDRMKTIVFSASFPLYDKSQTQALYVPYAYNFKAIDGLILRFENEGGSGKGKGKDKKLIAHLIAIQVTISPSRSKVEEKKFFDNWSQWIAQLGGYEVWATFLWITGDKLKSEKVEKTNKNPAYTREYITFAEVNQDIDNGLARARKL
jgi:hypothetical protein